MLCIRTKIADLKQNRGIFGGGLRNGYEKAHLKNS